MKLVVNFFGASVLELIGEVFVFAEKRDLNPAVLGGILKTMFHHPALPEYVEKIRTRNFDNDIGFTLDGGLKDIRLILEAAAEVRVPLPCASLLRDKMIAAQAHGMGQRDWSALTEVSRHSAGQA
jgi:3-hydroxyisobutyrate dehydrogenase-like beta-hydroxyacid dehydrogenase